MEISADVILHGNEWNSVVNKMNCIFQKRPHFSVFLLALAIGIKYDKQIEKLDTIYEPISIPRTVLLRYSSVLDNLYQVAVLTTKNINMNEEHRLCLAFDESEKAPFKKIPFLLSFANYGITILDEITTSDSLETMDNLIEFMSKCMSGFADVYDLTNLELSDSDFNSDEFKLDL